MSNDKTGGSAFPYESHSDEWCEGMTLRDYFAAHAARAAADAVCSLLEDGKHDDALVEAQRHATSAYMIADAMLRARTK